VRTDPTDNGGLFVGRRPGTRPVRYREAPQPGGERRRRADALFAHALLALMVFVNLLFWGPIPAGWLWIVSNVTFLSDRVFLALSVAFFGILMSLMLALVGLKQLDQLWILARRASGIDQRDGVIGRVFAYTAVVGASLFSAWLIFGGGLADSLTSRPTP
jgi:hypothetical protein